MSSDFLICINVSQPRPQLVPGIYSRPGIHLLQSLAYPRRINGTGVHLKEAFIWGYTVCTFVGTMSILQLWQHEFNDKYCSIWEMQLTCCLLPSNPLLHPTISITPTHYNCGPPDRFWLMYLVLLGPVLVRWDHFWQPKVVQGDHFWQSKSVRGTTFG